MLVVELKKGRASDVVVGQIQRYMGYVLGELAEEGQSVKGVIIALEDDLRIRRALQVVNNIDFYRYEVSFKLNKEQLLKKIILLEYMLYQPNMVILLNVTLYKIHN